MTNGRPVETQPFELSAAHAAHGRMMDALDLRLSAAASRSAPPAPAPASALPPWVDHSAYVRFVRHQGSWGCGMNAQAACWDILLAKYCGPSVHPTISVNRMLWAKAWSLRCWPEDRPCGERSTLPIPGQAGNSYTSVDEYLHSMGCPTEGTELTDADGVRWPTTAGDLECQNYRLDRHPLATGADFHHDVHVDVGTLKYWLNGGPVRVGIWGNHFVALVGYDDSESRFTFLNSWGDRYGENGFGHVPYDRVGQDLDSAQVYQFVPPPPVQCARIRFTSQRRQDVHLWLGIEGTTLAKKIWPSNQRQDDSRNLWLTVTIPPGPAWPPASGTRLFLDVYDAAEHSLAGGEILEFSAHFQDDHRFCSEILRGTPDPDDPGGASGIVPRRFVPRQVTRLTIP